MRAAKGSGWLIRLQEKGGKQHMMPCHHALAEALHAYIAAAGIGADKKAFLFRTSRGHGGTVLADQPMTQVDAWRMVRKRALAAGIMAPIGNQDHGVSREWRHAGARAVDGGARKPPHHQTLRPNERAPDAGRGREDNAVKSKRCIPISNRDEIT
jgi:integrase